MMDSMAWHGVCGTAVGLMLLAGIAFELSGRHDARIAREEQAA
jgi:hypothetical protein